MTNENDTQVLVNKVDLGNLVSAAKDAWFSMRSEGYPEDGYDLTQLNNAIVAIDKGWA
mgnify:CR=1 FL=1